MQTSSLLLNRIQTLWLVLLFGIVAHTLLELIPLFFGIDIAMPEEAEYASTATWMTLVILLVPLIMVVLSLYKDSQGMRLAQLVLAGLFFLLNLAHPMELLEAPSVPWHQVCVMLFNIVVSGLLLHTSWLWYKDKSFKK